MEMKTCKECRKTLPITMFKKIKDKYSLNKCKACYAKENTKTISVYEENVTDKMIIDSYNKLLNNEIKCLPNAINKRENHPYVLIKYCLEELLNCKTKEDICTNLNGNVFEKYKIRALSYKCEGGIMGIVDKLYPQYNIKPWELKYGNIHGMYDTNEDRKDCIEWFLDKLINDSVIKNKIDIIKRKDIYKLFQKNSIGSLLKSAFNNSSVNCLMWYFNNFTNNKINEWDFATPQRNFWLNKDNCIRAYKYMLKEEGFDFEWKDEKKRDFIIHNIQKDTFRKYNIEGGYSYFGNIYEITKQTFNKELFYQWELIYTPSNFWMNKDNRDKALIQLTKRLELSNEDIPNYLYQGSLRETEYNKFNTICTNYYKGNYYYWLNEIYPNKFKIEDFDVSESKDGIIFSSKDELRVYEYIKYQLDENIKYIGNKKYKQYFYSNEKENENYQPDFIIKGYNKDVVVEYFGLYNPNSKSNIIKNYTDKTNRKIKYFNSMEDIFFIPIFPSDIRNNFMNITEKIKELK